MKGMILGVAGLGGVGAAAYVGGGSGPNDYIGVVNKSPEAVYAAFSALGPEGIISVPSPGGWGARLVQRVVKVPNEKVKLELLVDDVPLLTAEIQLAAAENQGTQVAAELDLNTPRLRELVREASGGEVPVPEFALQESILDQVFAQAMGEMVGRIEAGEPLMSLADTRMRWGSGTGNGRPTRMTGQPVSGTWQQRGAVRPQVDARPTMNPNDAARQHMAKKRPGETTGW